VPLSEEEQRILHEIERNFYEQDPAFADKVRNETIYRHAWRNLKWATLGFFVGLIVLVATFSRSLILGIVGFLVMLGSALLFERNLRHAGRAGWHDMSRSVRDRGLLDSLGQTGERLRERFKRED